MQERICRNVLVGLALLVFPLAHLFAQSSAPQAGTITALIPAAKLVQGTGKGAAVLEVKKTDSVRWNDLLQTDVGGRMRVVLDDQSILSLGSKSELRVVKHDSKTQQTQLELTYGRVRAEVAAVVRNGGAFELRTPTAVAGVIGTEFTVEVDEAGETTVTCLKGTVSVQNVDPKVKGEEKITEGHVTTVKHGKKPNKPRVAPSEDLLRINKDTDVDENKFELDRAARGKEGEGKTDPTGSGKSTDSAGADSNTPDSSDSSKKTTSTTKHTGKKQAARKTTKRN